MRSARKLCSESPSFEEGCLPAQRHRSYHAGMPKRGRVVAVASAAVAIAVLVAAGIAAWPHIEEDLCIQRLRSDDEEECLYAAKRLGELGSVRAVPVLIVLAVRGP